MRNSRLLVQALCGAGIAAAAVALTLLISGPSRQASAAAADENRQLRAQLEQSRAATKAIQAERDAASESARKAEADADSLRRFLDEQGIPLLPWPDRRAGASQFDVHLRGVIKDMRTINQTLYATISIGAAQQVAKGMRFSVVDEGNFLGYLTVDSVDTDEAVGHVTGPNLEAVRRGSSVRTQW